MSDLSPNAHAVYLSSLGMMPAIPSEASTCLLDLLQTMLPRSATLLVIRGQQPIVSFQSRDFLKLLPSLCCSDDPAAPDRNNVPARPEANEVIDLVTSDEEPEGCRDRAQEVAEDASYGSSDFDRDCALPPVPEDWLGRCLPDSLMLAITPGQYQVITVTYLLVQTC